MSEHEQLTAKAKAALVVYLDQKHPNRRHYEELLYLQAVIEADRIPRIVLYETLKDKWGYTFIDGVWVKDLKFSPF